MAKSLSRYALLIGRPGGQTLNGSNTTGEHLTLKSNPLGDGKVFIGSNIVFDEANARLAVGTPSASTTYAIDVGGDTGTGIRYIRVGGATAGLKLTEASSAFGFTIQHNGSTDELEILRHSNNSTGVAVLSISRGGNQTVISNNLLEMRNGSTAQTFNIYNTYTDANTHERGFAKWSSNVFLIGTEKGSSGGTARELRVSIDGTQCWRWTAGGHFWAATDNAVDIGSSGSNRPRDLHVARNATIAGNVTMGGVGAESTLSIDSTIKSGTTAAIKRTGSVNNGSSILDLRFGGTPSPGRYFLRFQRDYDNTPIDVVRWHDGGLLDIYSNDGVDIRHRLTSANNSSWVCYGAGSNAKFGVATNSPIERLTVAGHIAAVKGTSATHIYAYGTYTDSTNYERGYFKWQNNALRIGTEKGSSGGSARQMQLLTDGTIRMTFATNENISVSSHLWPNGNNTYTLGTNSNRWSTIYGVAGNFTSGGITVTSGPLTSSTPALAISQTWNAVTNFRAIQLNVTNTLSGGSARLMRFAVDGSEVFTVNPSGNMTFGGTLHRHDGTTGIQSTSVGNFVIHLNGTQVFGTGNVNEFTVRQAAAIGWSSSSSNVTSSPDTYLYRDAANRIAMRNGTNAQTFRVYNTYTDGSNYEFGYLGWSGNALNFGTGKAGTGSTRHINVVVGGTAVWRFNNGGHFLANTDNAYDIGASGANRPRNIFAAGNISANAMTVVASVQVGFDSFIRFGTSGGTGRTIIQCPADGTLQLLNNASTGFTALYLGPITTAPSLRVSGTDLQVRLGDNSDFTKIQGQLQTHANAVAETPTATHTLTLYDAAGTAYKVLAVAA